MGGAVEGADEDELTNEEIVVANVDANAAVTDVYRTGEFVLVNLSGEVKCIAMITDVINTGIYEVTFCKRIDKDKNTYILRYVHSFKNLMNLSVRFYFMTQVYPYRYNTCDGISFKAVAFTIYNCMCLFCFSTLANDVAKHIEEYEILHVIGQPTYGTRNKLVFAVDYQTQY